MASEPVNDVHSARPLRALGWLMPLVLLAAIGAGVAVAVRSPAALFGWIGGAVLVVSIGWVLVSSLLPSKADRRCPACGEDALERLDPRTTRGLACASCGWVDATRSSFYLAEEEGPLEEVALRERGRAALVDRPPRRTAAPPTRGEPLVIRSWTGAGGATRRTQEPRTNGEHAAVEAAGDRG